MANKKLLEQTGRWLRVGTMTVSTLGPLVSTLVTRLRAQRELVPVEYTTTTVKSEPVLVAEEPTEKPSFSESLASLRDRAYNQELIKRGEELAEELLARGSHLSQLLAERGSDLTHELGKRSGDLTHELSKQSEKVGKQLSKQSENVGKQLSKRSEKIGKQLSKQTRKVSRDLSERDNTFWIIAGFSVGVTAASIVAFVLIRRRLQHQQKEDEHILLSQNGHIGVNNVAQTLEEKRSVSEGGASVTPNYTDRVTGAAPLAESSPVSTQEPVSTSSQATPADAAFLGIVSTKRYYPAQTPLDQLSTSSEQPLDVVYFASEEEARSQGFSAAESN